MKFAFQVCDLQSKVKHFSRDNEELRTSLCAYKETQDELTGELSDFKEKYREVVDLLHDTKDDLRRAKRRGGGSGGNVAYPGAGQHSVSDIFSPTGATATAKDEAGKDDLELEAVQRSNFLLLLRTALKVADKRIFLFIFAPREFLPFPSSKFLITREYLLSPQRRDVWPGPHSIRY